MMIAPLVILVAQREKPAGLRKQKNPVVGLSIKSSANPPAGISNSSGAEAYATDPSPVKQAWQAKY